MSDAANKVRPSSEKRTKTTNDEKLRIISCIDLGLSMPSAHWLARIGREKKKKNKGPGDLRKGPRRYQIRKKEGRKHRDCGGLSARLILFFFFALWRRAY
ncbi:uncharacterized protein TrAtP1_011396 [Trichoderma atroviride]|uniref:uncharacterized protein n=1 Tax=Hypocrea atroviridis TaxID=63577 RepID=UPI00331BF8A4|nr:hypothetical protein TrAtP1_011396 [Trichoderma atroviride]